MQAFIGIDGGGTGSRAQAELESGARTQIVTGGAANVASDPRAALAEITRLLARVHAEAKELGAVGRVTIVMGLAGVVESGAEEMLRRALALADLKIMGDVDIALAGAFMGDDGIVVTVGTGSVVAGARDGQVRRLGGYGLTLGDEGSGAWIGREALRRALRARDGLTPDGALPQALWQRFGSLAEVIGFASTARPADFASLAPLVLEQDRAHCPVAGAILDQGCAWLRAAITRLQAGDAEMPVAPLGGLGPALLERMARQGDVFRLVMPKGSALDGAIWRARHLRGGA